MNRTCNNTSSITSDCYEEPDYRGLSSYDIGFLLISFSVLVACYFIGYVLVAQNRSQNDAAHQQIRAARDDLIKTQLIVRQWHKSDDGEESSATSRSTTLDLSSHHEENGPTRKGVSRKASTGTTEIDDGGPCIPDTEVSENVENCEMESDDEIGSDVCSICLAPFENNESVCESNNFSCVHMFHEACMVSWLNKHNQCPVCRQVYLVETA